MKPSRKGWGLRPPLSVMGFHEAGGRPQIGQFGLSSFGSLRCSSVSLVLGARRSMDVAATHVLQFDVVRGPNGPKIDPKGP
jgi:hypothetical protein